MLLKEYLDLYALLQNDSLSRNERRTFGLAHPELKANPVKQLLLWAREKRTTLKKPLLSDTVSSYLYGITLTLTLFAFILGIFSGIALLSYNGHEPVNVVYFMAMVVLLPLFTMTLTLFSMLRANSSRSMLVHISPAFWMERILSLLPNKLEEKIKGAFSEQKISPLVLNWLIIKRSQILALAFSLGLLFALLGMVATRDIAFAWSTTLSISPEEFHHFLQTVAFSWRDLFPWAVPSLELVEKSQYYRLGEHLGEEMISRAALLGEWWKFLLFATLFYAIILRFFVYLFSVFGLNRAIKRSCRTLEGAEQLLYEMNEPVISTGASVSENDFKSAEVVYARQIQALAKHYDTVLGWAIDKEHLPLINESMHLTSSGLYEAGGANSLEEDREVIDQSAQNVLFYVKAWEPPTMDFIDFLEMLVEKVDKVTVLPLGTQSENYVAKKKDVDVWARKLFILDSEKVWMKI